MIDLTAVIEKLDDNHKTHMDLYYVGYNVSTDKLITDCVMLDISKSPEAVDTDSMPSLSLIEKGNSVILKTGWESKRLTAKYNESPWIDMWLIHHLVKLGVSLILVDSPGVYGGAEGREHNDMDKYLADNKAYAVENLVNLDKIKKDKFKLYCFPILSTSTNTAPCRVLAEI